MNEIKYFVLKDGTKMCYTENGSGRPVIFIHGWGESKQNWNAYEKPLAEAGFRYICMDQRASKDTEPSKTRPVTLDMLVRDVHDLIEGLSLEDVTLVGHSMGVGITLQYILFYGCEHLHSLILMDCPPRDSVCENYEYALYGNTYTVKEALEAANWMMRDMKDYLTDWIKGSAPDIKNAPDPEKAAEEWAVNYMSAFHVQETAELYDSLVGNDYRDALPKITIPTLYLYPAPGNICVEDTWKIYKEKITGPVTVESFPSTSHFFCLEEEHLPAVKKAMIQFLKN